MGTNTPTPPDPRLIYEVGLAERSVPSVVNSYRIRAFDKDAALSRAQMMFWRDHGVPLDRQDVLRVILDTSGLPPDADA